MEKSYLKKHLFIITLLLPLIGCNADSRKSSINDLDQHSYDLGVVAGFSELINVFRIFFCPPRSSLRAQRKEIKREIKPARFRNLPPPLHCNLCNQRNLWIKEQYLYPA